MLRAALGYDMVRAVAMAARRAGAQPDRIREELASGFRFDGQSGSFHFDRAGNRVGAIRVGVVRGGELVAPAGGNSAQDQVPTLAPFRSASSNQ